MTRSRPCFALLIALAPAAAPAADGDLDTTFQDGGRWVLDIPSSGANAVGVAPDGRLVVGYTRSTGIGSDTNFQTQLVPDSGNAELCATWAPDLGGNNSDVLMDLAVFGDQMILAGSAAGPAADPERQLAVARFSLDDCVIDPGFGGPDGYFYNPSVRIDAMSIATDTFGGVVIAAEQGDDGAYNLHERRLDQNGVFDDALTVSFFTAFGASNFQPRGVFVQPNGRRIVAGMMALDNGDYDVGLAVFTPAGALDTSFSIDGLAGFSYDIVDSGLDSAYAVAALPDGRIVVAGTVQHGSSYDAAFAILTATGGYYNDFGLIGRYSFDFAAGDRTEVIRAIAIQGDDKIVAAGYTAPAPPATNVDFAVARLETSGDLPLDPGFGSGGKRIIPFNEGGANSDYGYDVTLDQGGRITVGGWVATAAHIGLGAVRLQNDYIFADGFEWGVLYGAGWDTPQPSE